jgi:diguanylate cyclase (GGDEF)-like protein
VDRFKAVNDCHGHAVGDQLLRALAERLRHTVGPGDLIARQGGDEFLVLHRKISSRACARLGARLLRALNRRVELDGLSIEPSVSIGVSSFPRDGDDAHTLTLRADQAMYQAKRSGRNFLRFFDANLRRRIDDDIVLKRELRAAIDAGAVTAEFQPIMDAHSGALTGFETLARWVSPSLGPIPPERFITIAEENGLIVDLGAHMRAQAFAFAAALRDMGLSRPVAVNVSQLELAQAGFAAGLLEQLGAHRLAPEAIVLEITESLFHIHSARELEGLFALRQKGVRFALDDFGKGFSSHSHLRAYPIDRLKICADFVGDIVTDPQARAVVRSLVQLGRSLNLAVTVEGVETAAQRDLVAVMGADEIQGFWHHAPMTAAAAIALVHEERGRGVVAPRAWLSVG